MTDDSVSVNNTDYVFYLRNIWRQDALREEGKPARLMLCWETLDPVIHVDVTLKRFAKLNIAADHVHPFLETISWWLQPLEKG